VGAYRLRAGVARVWHAARQHTAPGAAVAIARIYAALGEICARRALRTKIVPRMFRIMVNPVQGVGGFARTMLPICGGTVRAVFHWCSCFAVVADGPILAHDRRKKRPAVRLAPWRKHAQVTLYSLS
jgi:hypothetical protein